MKEEYEALPYQIRKKVENIKHQSKFGTKLNVFNYDSDEGYDDENPMNKMTGLRRDQRGGNRGGGDRRREKSRRRDDRDDRRDRGKSSNREDGGNRKRDNKPVFQDESFPTM